MSAGCARLPEKRTKRARAPRSSTGAWQHRGGGSALVAGAGRVSSLSRQRGRPGAALQSRVTAGGAGRAFLRCAPRARGCPGAPHSFGAHRGGVWVASLPRAARPASRSRSLCLPGLRVCSVCARALGASSPVTRCQLSRSPRQTFARGDAAWAAGGVSLSWREKGGVGLPRLPRPEAAPQSWCCRCSAPSYHAPPQPAPALGGGKPPKA